MIRLNYTNLLMISTMLLVLVVKTITLQDGTPVYIYFSSIISLLYIIKSIPGFYTKLKYLDKSDKSLVILTLIYIIYINLQYMFINNEYKYIVYNESITLLTFIFIVLNIRNKNNLTSERDFILKLGIFTIVLFLIFGILGKDISFSSNSIVSITDIGQDGIKMWFMHKSRLASYLVIILSVILVSNISAKLKRISIIIILTLVYMTKSTTALILLIIALIYLYITKNSQKIHPYIRYNFYTLALLFFIGTAIMLFNYVSSVKNITTLGDRTNIWLSIIPTILENPMGIGSSFNYKFEFREYLYVNSAHNVFLQELLENGYMCGIMFISIIIIIAITIYNNNKIYFALFMVVVLLANMDITIYQEFYNIFFYLIAFIYCDCKSNNNKLMR